MRTLWQRLDEATRLAAEPAAAGEDSAERYEKTLAEIAES